MKRPELVAFALAGVVVVAAAVLVVAGDVVPTWFPIVALAAVTGGAGLSIPGRDEATSSGEPTNTDGWTLSEVTSWIDSELTPKIEKALARSHVHAPVSESPGPETTAPAVAPQTPPTPPGPVA